MSFGSRLKQARTSKGLNQENLGILLGGVSKQTVSHWEVDRFEPSIEQLAALCDLLDTSADYLVLGRSPDGLPPDAIQEARFYNSLSLPAKKKWKLMRALFTPTEERQK